MMLHEHSIAASLVFVREHPATRAKDRSTTRSIMPSEISLEWMPKYRLSRSNLRTAQCCARYGTVFLIVKLSSPCDICSFLSMRLCWHILRIEVDHTRLLPKGDTA